MKKIYIMLVITFGLFVSVVTAADLVEKRRDAFKANAQSMKAMRPNIKAENFDAIAINAQKIADWAAIMPEHFPENTPSKGARQEIWTNFADFEAKANANHKAALTLKTAAETMDRQAVITAVKQLGASCKDCHNLYKAD